MRIAIIGGGAAAISLLHQLIGKLSDISNAREVGFEPIEIFVIEKHGEIGPGLAYSTTDHSHILNLPAKVMSPIPENPRHFFDWAMENKNLWQHEFPTIGIERCDFPPRALYGMYLKWLFEDLVKKAAAEKIVVKPLVNHEVIDIRQEVHSENFKVVFANQDTPPLMCQKVVLSIGHLESENYIEFKQYPGYIHSPWSSESLGKIPASSAVFIAGTRLTAIDAVLSLKQNGHTGKIILGSHLGLLPTVMGNVDSGFNRKYLTMENIIALSDYGTKKIELERVIELLQWEFDNDPDVQTGAKSKFDLQKIANPNMDPIEFLRQDIQEVKSGRSRYWQNVLFSLYTNISVMWDALSERAKEVFIKKYYSVWMTYLAAFPLENAEKILLLLEKGEIEICKDLQTVVFNTEANRFNIQFKATAEEAEYFINATGAGHNMVNAPYLLIQNMMKSGMLVPYRLGGVKVDFKSLQATGAQGMTCGLFVMGDSGTYGACMATADLSQLGKQAARIANTLEEQIRCEPTLKKTRAASWNVSTAAPVLMYNGTNRSLSADIIVGEGQPQLSRMSNGH